MILVLKNQYLQVEGISMHDEHPICPVLVAGELDVLDIIILDNNFVILLSCVACYHIIGTYLIFTQSKVFYLTHIDILSKIYNGFFFFLTA